MDGLSFKFVFFLFFTVQQIEIIDICCLLSNYLPWVVCGFDVEDGLLVDRGWSPPCCRSSSGGKRSAGIPELDRNDNGIYESMTTFINDAHVQ